MNQLAIIRKHLKAIDKAWEGIATAETRKRAGGLIRESAMKWEGYELPSMQVVGLPAPSVSLAVPEPVGGVLEGGAVLSVTVGGRPVEAVVSPLDTYKGNPVLEPITDHTWEVGEPEPGVMPSREAEAVGIIEALRAEPVVEVVGDTEPAETEIPPVNLIGGWPERAEIVISGLAPNRRHLRGTLPDNRVVTVERTMAKEWKAGQKTSCRLIRAGAACLYRVA